MYKKQHIKAPSLAALFAAEFENEKLGHENLGFLSVSNGFMPINEPLKSLPESFLVWDQLCANTPQLIKDMQFRKMADAMPVLLPSKEKLAEPYLYRAAMLLGFFAHAYANSAGELLTQDEVPDSIMIPWRIVSERLGRPETFLSYFDLIANNWYFKNSDDKNRTLENMRLMYPIFDCKEERNLYLIQTEMMAEASPMVYAAAQAQQAIFDDNHDVLINSLEKMTSCIYHLANISFSKLAYLKRSKSYMDPVAFAKTMMSFAVPIHSGVPGPSGTSFPYAHLIDSFIGRKIYDEGISKEALKIRSLYPKHVKNFLQAISEVSVGEYIKKTESPILIEKYTQLMNSYTGDKGFLNMHRKRVYGFVQTSFKVGRPQTIGGFNGDNEEEWATVDTALRNMRNERPQCPFAQKTKTQQNKEKQPKQPIQRPSEENLNLSNIVQRCSEKTGHWVIANDKVLDISTYIKKHPGGEASLKEFAGSDITKEFHRIHEDSIVANKLLEKFTIGNLKEPEFKNIELTDLWTAQKRFLLAITELYNLYQLETNVQYTDCFPNDEGANNNRYKKFLSQNSSNRFSTVYKSQLEEKSKDLFGWATIHFPDWNQRCPFSKLSQQLRFKGNNKNAESITYQMQLDSLLQLKSKATELCRKLESECEQENISPETYNMIKGVLRAIPDIDK